MNRNLLPAQWPAVMTFVRRMVAPASDKVRTTGRNREPVVKAEPRLVVCSRCGRSSGTLEKHGDEYGHAACWARRQA